MKFSVKKKLNLSRIDKDLWPYEDETFEASDADSFEEAQKRVDMYYSEREGYHRAISEARRAERNKQSQLPLPTPAIPAIPRDTVAPVANPTVNAPVAPVNNSVVNAPVVENPANSDISNQPPKEFN